MPKKKSPTILKQVAEAVVKFEAEKVVQLSKKAMKEGLDPLTVIQKGLTPGMEKAGDLFQKKIYFVPELLMCSEALTAGIDLLRPLLAKDQAEVRKGRIGIGTIQGDVHEVGKNLVALMLDIKGFEVIDMGVDVSLERFLSEHRDKQFDVIAISALMSTTMLRIKDFIPKIKKKDKKVKIMVGGSPLSAKIAKMLGADGYADDAQAAVDEAKRLVGIK